MKISRRDLFHGLVGFSLGGATAVAGGLYYRAHRQRRRLSRNTRVPVGGDDGWLITEEERIAAEAFMNE